MLTDSTSSSFRNCYEFSNEGCNTNMDNLFEFLKEAQLEHYYEDFSVKLKIRCTAQLKYVDETDLTTIGLSRPEMRRLKKYFDKEFPQTAMGKIKKRLTRSSSNRSTSVPRPQDLSGRINSFSVKMNGNGHTKSPMGSDDLTTIASVTNFSIASNGTTESHDVRHQGSKHLILQNQLTIESRIKHGEFSDVYQGTYRAGQTQKQVSIKCISKIHLKNDLNEFIKEMFIQCYLDHPNIVKLYGISLEDQNIKMVTEPINVNSLLKCLQDPNSKTTYSIVTLHSCAVQIGEAMAYLEEKRVIHGHLTSNNVLLYSDNQIKIMDAGLFRSYSSNERNNFKDHREWIAPEIINGYQPNLSSDVWAFGVLLWEMYSYCHYPSRTNESIGSQADLKIPNLLQPDLCPNMMYDIITTCWNEQARDRPTFFQLSSYIVRLVPEQLVALVDGPDQIPSQRSDDVNEPSDGSYSSLTELQMLYYKKGDSIIVLDRSMNLYKDFWRGCLLNGESGYFKWENMRAAGVNQSVISEVIHQAATNKNQHSPTTSIKSACRSRSVGEAFAKLRNIGRESDKRHKSGRISIDMISAPQNDFRHIGHVSNNGDVFGDVTSLYTTTAQEKIRSGVISVGSKINTSSSLSEGSSVISTSTLNAGGDDTPPYATIDNETAKSLSDKNKSNILVPPPLPPTRSYSEEEATMSCLMDDISLSNEFSFCTDGYSLFNELSKQWDMQYSSVETEVTPTSDKKVHISETKSSLNSECPTIMTNTNSVDSPVASKNERIPAVLSFEKLPKSSSETTSQSASFVVSPTIKMSNTNILPNRSSSFFTKFRTLGTGKSSKSKEDSTPTETNVSPLYAKIKKSNKAKKIKEVNPKKNIISNPILISPPIASPNSMAEENYLDCSSEVSSLQPSPRESVVGIANAVSMNVNSNTDQTSLLNRQFSNTTNQSRNKMNGSTTSVSPASSFVSLTSTQMNSITQSGAAIRAIKKGDGVFRATALNRRRPSASDQFAGENTLSRNRQPSLPLVSSMNRMNSSTIDRRYYRAGGSNNEILESVLDSSATTPIASELPDLPYIDLSFTRPLIEDKTNTGDEDDAYNSLHSGSVGSDPAEQHFPSKTSDSHFEHHNHQSLNEKPVTQFSKERPPKSNSFFEDDLFSPSIKQDSSFKNFQMKSKKFINDGDSDEVAL